METGCQRARIAATVAAPARSISSMSAVPAAMAALSMARADATSSNVWGERASAGRDQRIGDQDGGIALMTKEWGD